MTKWTAVRLPCLVTFLGETKCETELLEGTIEFHFISALSPFRFRFNTVLAKRSSFGCGRLSGPCEQEKARPLTFQNCLQIHIPQLKRQQRRHDNSKQGC